MSKSIDWLSYATPLIAILGFALGLLNTIWAISRDRTQLRIYIEPAPPHLAILNEVNPIFVRIVNVSLFPVTLGDIQATRRWFRSPTPINFFVPEESASWPPLLAPGATCSVQIWRDAIDRPGFSADAYRRQIHGLRVTTATGKAFQAKSRQLHDYLN